MGWERRETNRQGERRDRDIPTSFTTLPVSKFLGDGDPFSFLRNVFADDGEEEIAVLFGGPA